MSSSDQQSSPKYDLPQTTVLVPSRRKTTATTKEEPRVFSPFDVDTGSTSSIASIAPGCTVLLVDDNMINQNIGARMLLSLGCRVYVAHDGDDAINQVCICAGIPPPVSQHSSDTFPPPRPARSKSLSALTYRRAIAPDVIDVILMDYQMPIKDGMTATREIRAMEASGKFSSFEADTYFGKRWPVRLPIIAATTLDNQETRDAFVEAGIDGFAKKPFSLQSLRETVGRVMVEKQKREQDEVYACECCMASSTLPSSSSSPVSATTSAPVVATTHHRYTQSEAS